MSREVFGFAFSESLAALQRLLSHEIGHGIGVGLRARATGRTER